MNRSLLVAFLTAVIIGLLVFVGSFNLNTVKADTVVNGTISSNTIWTKANSPYNLTGTVLVNNGVTLTIEPGVTVNLFSYSLEVNGTLRAQGTNTENINFISTLQIIPYRSNGAINFTSYSTIWDKQTGSGCTIENAVLTTTTISIGDTSPEISNNTFNGTPFGSAISINGGSPVISNNIITGPGGGFANSGVMCVGNTNASISGNLISGWWVSNIWISGDNPSTAPTIENNIITESDGAVNAINPGGGIRILGYASPIIRNNTIANNNASGIRITDYPSPIIINNNLYGNPYNIYLSSGTNINATYNWWGTTDPQEINQTIYDSKNDSTIGTVNFVPFLTAPNPEAPEGPSPTPTASPSPTPGIPEFPSFAVLPLLIAAAVLEVILLKRKQSNKTNNLSSHILKY